MKIIKIKCQKCLGYGYLVSPVYIQTQPGSCAVHPTNDYKIEDCFVCNGSGKVNVFDERKHLRKRLRI